MRGVGHTDTRGVFESLVFDDSRSVFGSREQKKKRVHDPRATHESQGLQGLVYLCSPGYHVHDERGRRRRRAAAHVPVEAELSTQVRQLFGDLHGLLAVSAACSTANVRETCFKYAGCLSTRR